MNPVELHTKIFADGADKISMLEMYRNPLIKGFTTNPTLMRKAGIINYEGFAKEVLTIIHDRPISFEVFSDDFDEMYYQALKIASFGDNVYAKIPITNSKGESACDLIHGLAQAGVKQNVTAIMTLEQVKEVTAALSDGPSAYVSVFAGRIADTGRDPLPIMKASVDMLRPYSQLELIWASPRELLNVFQAHEVGCHIITATHDIIKKMSLVGKDLQQFSLETVQMFRNDAIAAGYTLETEEVIET
jgi:transaldolase